MSRPVRSAALQAANFSAAVRNETMNDSDESDDYSEDNDNMNQNNTKTKEDLPENEVKIATQHPDDTSEDEIAVPMAEQTLSRQILNFYPQMVQSAGVKFQLTLEST